MIMICEVIMDTGKEIVYILKNLVKELHELNRTLGRISRASILTPSVTSVTLKNTLDDTKETSDSQ